MGVDMAPDGWGGLHSYWRLIGGAPLEVGMVEEKVITCPCGAELRLPAESVLGVKWPLTEAQAAWVFTHQEHVDLLPPGKVGG